MPITNRVVLRLISVFLDLDFNFLNGNVDDIWMLLCLMRSLSLSNFEFLDHFLKNLSNKRLNMMMITDGNQNDTIICTIVFISSSI